MSKKSSRDNSKIDEANPSKSKSFKKKKTNEVYPPIPVVLLSGFLGSGKTTLLKHILTNKKNLKVALIVNDMASLNIDAELLRQSKLVQVEEEMIQLQNGCVCCTLRNDLVREIKKIYDKHAFDVIVVESTGISEPMNVAESFEIDHETLKLQDNTASAVPLSTIAKLDTCVTVVDLSTFSDTMKCIKNVKDLTGDQDDEQYGDKPIGQLFIDQLEFANVIVLNKADCVESKQINEYISFIDEILLTGLYDPEEAKNASGWLQDLVTGEIKPETEEYNITSFVYKARKPFHPKRLHDWLSRYFILSNEATSNTSNKAVRSTSLQKLADSKYEQMTNDIGGVLRSKGFIWVASRNDWITELNHGGRFIELNKSLPWFASLPTSDWDADEATSNRIWADFEEPYGDRRQEIVFIGIRLNKDFIEKTLNSCLLTESEMNLSPNLRRMLKDPLPCWPVAPGFWSGIIGVSSFLNISIPQYHMLTINQIVLISKSGNQNANLFVKLVSKGYESFIAVCSSSQPHARVNIQLDQEIVSFWVESSDQTKKLSEDDLFATQIHLTGYVEDFTESDENEDNEENEHEHKHEHKHEH